MGLLNYGNMHAKFPEFLFNYSPNKVYTLHFMFNTDLMSFGKLWSQAARIDTQTQPHLRALVSLCKSRTPTCFSKMLELGNKSSNVDVPVVADTLLPKEQQLSF